MVSELNGLLERLREALETQKRFAANPAHELRSPLTALSLQVQLIERAQSREERSACRRARRRGGLERRERRNPAVSDSGPEFPPRNAATSSIGRTIMNCTEVCPKGLSPARAIERIKLQLLRRSC